MQINSLILAIHILSVEYESGFGVVIFLKAYMILHICSILRSAVSPGRDQFTPEIRKDKSKEGR